MNSEFLQPAPDGGSGHGPGDCPGPTPGVPPDAAAELIEGLLEGKVDADGGPVLEHGGEQAAPSDVEPLIEQVTPPKRRHLPDWFLPGAEDERWSHRRGEPRTFAFLWTLYLLLATVGMFWRVIRSGVPTLDIYRSGMQLLVVTATLGATLIWPMVRLCQESPPDRRRAHVLADVMVLLLPMQAVLWPQVLLAQWSVQVVLAADLLVCAWVIAIGAVLLSGWSRSGLGRAGAMATCLVLLGAGPMLGLAARAMTASGTGLGHWSLSSALTGVYVLTGVEHAEVRRGTVEPWQWQAIGLTWLFALAAWGLAWGRGWGRTAVENRVGMAPRTSPA